MKSKEETPQINPAHSSLEMYMVKNLPGLWKPLKKSGSSHFIMLNPKSKLTRRVHVIDCKNLLDTILPMVGEEDNLGFSQIKKIYKEEILDKGNTPEHFVELFDELFVGFDDQKFLLKDKKKLSKGLQSFFEYKNEYII